MSKYLVSPEITHPDLTGIDIAVWHGLSSFANWEFVNGTPAISKMCFPSLRALVNKTRFSLATVCRSLKKLEKLGYIKRLKGRKGKSTRYILVSENFIGVDFSEKDSDAENSVNSGYSHSDNTIVSERDTNSIYNIKKEKESGKCEFNAKIININNYNNYKNNTIISRRPLKNVPYDKRAYQVLTDMYYVCLNYEPDAPSEIRLLQDLSEEYPNINLFREFRKALDWLENRDLNARPSNLRRFLRKWVSNADTKNVIQMLHKRY